MQNQIRSMIGIWFVCATVLAHAQHIMLIHPNGSESYSSGDTIVFQWVLVMESYRDFGITVDLSRDDGLSWQNLSGGSQVWNYDKSCYSGDTGSFRWIVPAELFLIHHFDSVSLVSNTCRARIIAPYEQTKPFDISDSTFSIMLARTDNAAEDTTDGSPCGTGSLIALLPPLVIKITKRRRKKIAHKNSSCAS